MARRHEQSKLVTSNPSTKTRDFRRVRLAHLVSHPIQYQIPLFRRIAQEADIDFTVFFGSGFSLRNYRDQGFQVDVQWDIPLLGGYSHEFLPTLRDTGTEGTFTPICRGLTRALVGEDGAPKFDVLWVHGYATLCQIYGILVASALGIPVLIRSDSTPVDRPRARWKAFIKRGFFLGLRGLVDGILVVGTLNREYWKRHMGNDFPMFMVPYSVDNRVFQQRCRDSSAQRETLRKELNLEPGRPVILFASKLQSRKHCDDLIAAYKLLSPGGGAEPDPYLVIVGDGAERSALERQAEQTGFHSIRFCGFQNQSEIPRFLDLCSVFVLPSRHEPWGLIVNEAMNAGRPVIVSDDVGCQRDLVTDGIEGCVYPVRNVEALAEALRRVLATPATAVEMGHKALTKIDSWSFEQDIIGLRQALTYVSRQVMAGAIPQGSLL